VAKEATSFRLSPEALELIRELAQKLGITRTAVVELAVRRIAKDEIPERLSEKSVYR
jgi:hypothetical protein